MAKETAEKEGQTVDYKFGTMIEIPRACLTAGEIADEAEFFSFGTNDLTQMTYGMSRDDAGPFLMPYIAQEIYKEDPTVSIDTTGVGRLMQICVDDAKKVNPNIKLGICGEQGGDPDSVKILQLARPDLRLLQPQTRAGSKISRSASGVVKVVVCS